MHPEQSQTNHNEIRTEAEEVHCEMLIPNTVPPAAPGAGTRHWRGGCELASVSRVRG